MNPLLRRLRRTAAVPAGMVARAASRPLGGGGGLPLDPRSFGRGRDPLVDAVAGKVVMVTGDSSGIGESS